MANFEWLNDIPLDQWQKDAGGGHSHLFSLGNFLRSSEADVGTWRQEFDGWKFGQERVYESFHAPPFDGVDMIIITLGFRNA